MVNFMFCLNLGLEQSKVSTGITQMCNVYELFSLSQITNKCVIEKVYYSLVKIV